jgi:hypothetical protein
VNELLARLLGRLTFVILVVAGLFALVAVASRTAYLRDQLADAGCTRKAATAADAMEVAT